jgi:diguanylate cyclase (GGDEF)-like protein
MSTRSRDELPSIADDGDADATDGTVTNLRGPSKVPSRLERPFLIVLAGNNVSEMYALSQPEVTIGRAKAATIRIDDDGISRMHAKLTSADGVVHVEDLGSSNGTLLNGEKLVAPVVLKDGDKLTLGATTILKFSYSDEIEETYQRRMREAALRDGLTGAFNKRYLLDRLTTELAFAQRHKAPLSLIMLDVDHFKNINDTFGHPAGDAVLVRVATTVSEAVRKEDVFARYGGEEFAVLCRHIDVSQAAVLAERLRDRLAAGVTEHEGRRISVTVSLGVAGFPDVPVGTPQDLISAADAALYQAKASGRNRVVTRSSTG